MFAGEYLCKVDEKGRFIVPSPIREGLRVFRRDRKSGSAKDAGTPRL